MVDELEGGSKEVSTKSVIPEVWEELFLSIFAKNRGEMLDKVGANKTHLKNGKIFVIYSYTFVLAN